VTSPTDEEIDDGGARGSDGRLVDTVTDPRSSTGVDPEREEGVHAIIVERSAVKRLMGEPSNSFRSISK